MESHESRRALQSAGRQTENSQQTNSGAAAQTFDPNTHYRTNQIEFDHRQYGGVIISATKTPRVKTLHVKREFPSKTECCPRNKTGERASASGERSYFAFAHLIKLISSIIFVQRKSLYH